MRTQATIAVVLCVGAVAASATAFAQDMRPSTFGKAAAEADFPVYKPQRTLGLKARVITVANTCVPDAGKRMVIANYGRPGGGGPQLGIWQAKPFVCGNAGESRPYRTVRIHHQKVQVRVSCESPEPECKLNKGRIHSFLLDMRLHTGPNHRLTAIGMLSSEVSFARFVRVARSLRRVKPD